VGILIDLVPDNCSCITPSLVERSPRRSVCHVGLVREVEFPGTDSVRDCRHLVGQVGGDVDVLVRLKIEKRVEVRYRVGVFLVKDVFDGVVKGREWRFSVRGCGGTLGIGR